jgi:hypothetical protein
LKGIFLQRCRYICGEGAASIPSAAKWNRQKVLLMLDACG